MDNVWTYFVALPEGIAEMVAPCADGYAIYIDIRLTWEKRIAAFRHALAHIEAGDFDGGSVQGIEHHAHNGR